MGFGVFGGATLMCSFGAAPSTLMVLPTSRVMGKMPMATIMDQVPLVNILPFGMCSSMANPTVAAATAAKLGVMTPMRCDPNPEPGNDQRTGKIVGRRKKRCGRS